MRHSVHEITRNPLDCGHNARAYGQTEHLQSVSRLMLNFLKSEDLKQEYGVRLIRLRVNPGQIAKFREN